MPEPPPGFTDPLTGMKSAIIYCGRAPGWEPYQNLDYDALLDARSVAGFEVAF